MRNHISENLLVGCWLYFLYNTSQHIFARLFLLTKHMKIYVLVWPLKERCTRDEISWKINTLNKSNVISKSYVNVSKFSVVTFE